MPERRRVAPPRRGPAVLAAAALAIGAAAWWLWLSSGAPIAPPAPQDAALAADVSLSPAPAGGEQAAPASVRVERPAPGITGTAADAVGAALSGWTVELFAAASAEPRDEGAEPRELRGLGKRTPTDGRGVFAFEGFAPGTYWVALTHERSCRQRVVLAPGERREVSLRLRADRVAVSGTLTHGGEVDKDRWVAIVCADGRELSAGPDANGHIRCVLPPGLHRLRVIGTLRAKGGGPTFLREYPLAVPAGVATSRWQFEVGGTGLVLSVDTGAPDPIEGLAFAVEGRTALGDTEASFPVAVHDGRGALRELPPGSWTVRATSPWLLPVPPQELLVGPGDARLRLVLPARRAAVVRLEIAGPDGRQLALPLASLPPLLVAGEQRPCVDVLRCAPDPPPRGWRPDLARPAVPGYVSVPPERAELLLSDRELDGATLFLPFEPVAGTCIDVVAGATNRLALEVVPRAFVDLRACERSGREDPFARIEVFAGEQRVRSIGSTDSQRWQSYLPPGDYRAVVDRRGRSTESWVRVDRADVQRRLRP
ncbi:MAG TPA: carboxypeptidase-like regulatory domain-containing protein [Planctomycetota bacterium]|nr:carboxypeptidase-like regulatory domain-containing protein [Planctomycetota bacterium]